MSLSTATASALSQHPLRLARKVAVFLVGITVLLVGIALIVLPGPAIVVIPAGLAILATEFTWARSLLVRVREQSARLTAKIRRSRAKL